MILKSKFGSSVVIEDYCSDDIEFMSELHADAFDSQWSAEEIALTLSQSSVHALTLHLQGNQGKRKLMGFVIYSAAADEADIYAIAVDRKHRRRGFGQMLMEEVLRRLYRDRIKSLTLEVDGSNMATVNFYKKLKFKKVGERPAYYSKKEDKPSSALIMRHDL